MTPLEEKLKEVFQYAYALHCQFPGTYRYSAVSKRFANALTSARKEWLECSGGVDIVDTDLIVEFKAALE